MAGLHLVGRPSETGVSEQGHGNEKLGYRSCGTGYCCDGVHTKEEIGVVFEAGGVEVTAVGSV